MLDDLILTATLTVAVPQWAARAAAWEPWELRTEADNCAWIIACGADILFRHDPAYSVADLKLPTVVTITEDQAKAGLKARSYRPAEIFNAVAEAIGIGSIAPGGIVFAGRVWCAAHPRETEPGTAGACAACQAAERAA